MLLLTTPNETCPLSLAHLLRLAGRESMHEGWIQFGRAGEDHQFLFTRAELKRLLISRFELVDFTPGSSAVWNRRSEPAMRHALSRTLVGGLETIALGLPRIRPRVANQ